MTAADTPTGCTAAVTQGGEAEDGVGRRRPTLQIVGRLGWGVVDQAVSSLSNFALGLYVARSFEATSFGAFSLAYLTYSVVINASRGTSTDPLLVLFSGATRPRWRTAVSATSATALLTGVVAGLLSLVAGLLLPPPVGPAFIALAVGLPGLMLQDSWRFAFFAAGRGATALVNDLVWMILLLAALLALHMSGLSTVSSCLLAFGGTASLAAIWGSLQAGVLPRPRLIRNWLRETRSLSSRYVVENVSSSGAAQIRSFMLGGIAGLAAVGHVRGAEILMGPFLIVLMGISQVAVPEASRVFQRSPTRLGRFCLALGGVQATAALAWGVALLVVMPQGLGHYLLDGLWSAIMPLIPAVTVNVMAACFLTAAIAGLRAMGVAWRSLRVQLITSTAYVLFGGFGAALGGALGACWGAVAANGLGALVSWYHLRSALTDHHVGVVGGHSEAPRGRQELREDDRSY